MDEVIKHQVWKDAMHEEYESIMKNDVWDVVLILEDKEVFTSKWIYKIKRGSDGSSENFKAIFVAHGLSQKEGVDQGCRGSSPPYRTHSQSALPRTRSLSALRERMLRG